MLVELDMDTGHLVFGAGGTTAGFYNFNVKDHAQDAELVDSQISMIVKAIGKSRDVGFPVKCFTNCMVLRVHVSDDPKTTAFRYMVMEARDSRIEELMRRTTHGLKDVYLWYRRREPIRHAGCLDFIPEL